MARLARVIAVDTPHHVTQRGNDRRFVLDSDDDRRVYLDLLQRRCDLRDLTVLGYCLMTNHVHLIVIPRRPESLALALKEAHGQYAAFCNARFGSSGHVWQGRYYSCPLDARHLWTALRYVELNPVRARMVADPAAYPWSSAAAHCGSADSGSLLDTTLWRDKWSPEEWREFLYASEIAGDVETIRRHTHTGRPWGSAEFIEELETKLRRRLRPSLGGRPRKQCLVAS